MIRFILIIAISLLTISSAKSETIDHILIEKSARTLKLISGKTILKQYTVALGPNAVGPKRCMGDGKTPEGNYTIVSRNIHSQFYKSLRVSYPNAEDKKNAQNLKCNPGGDIMIHGLPNGYGSIGSAHTLHDWTAGCIAVTDSQIDEIWKLVPDGTKVQIVP